MKFMQLQIDFDGIDQLNTPNGMMAVLKSNLMSSDNICNHCDYRFNGCNDDYSTLANGKLIPCMNHNRKDGKCVFFIKQK
jgi:hypothetical protein